MIMNNYKKFLMGIQGYFTEATNGIQYRDVGIIGTDGTVRYMGIEFNNTFMSYASEQFRIDKNFYLAVGNGSETLTEDDYILASDISSSFTNLSYSTNLSVEGDEYKRTFTVSGTNNSGSEKTITRVAYYKAMYINQSTTAPILFAVCELSQAITVANGDSFAITLKWNDL